MMVNFIFFASTPFVFALTLTLIPKSIANFDPQIALYGDADLAADGSSVVLTRSGLILLRRPFAFLDPKLAKPSTFSTEFAFSVSAGGISLVMVPEDLASKLSVRTSLEASPENGFLVVANVSPADSKLAADGKSRCWIDYDPSSKRLEVRLAKFEESRPYNPTTAFTVDLPAMWKDRQVMIGLTSTNSSTVYSWSFKRVIFPEWIHSKPVDPRAGYHNHSEKPGNQRKRVCALAVIGGLIIATVCGALMAFSVLLVWAVVANRRSVFNANQSMGFRYEKIGVIVEKDSDGVKN